MSDQIEPGHGNSVAAWTTVTIIMIAFAIGTGAFWFNRPDVVYLSAGLVVVALIVGWILRKLGYGVNGSKTKSH